MDYEERLLFSWHFAVADREFNIETFADGNCILYDESIRRSLCHGDSDPRRVLLEEIDSDDASPAQDRKREFSVRFAISPPLLDLIREAREEFDRTGDVSKTLSDQINLLFAPIFQRDAEPFLTIPIKRDHAS